LFFRLLFFIFLLSPIGSTVASNITDFQNISNREPIDDSICTKFGGTPIPLTDNEIKTTIRNAKEVGRRLYYQNSIYIIYGSKANNLLSLVLPVHNMNLCRFPQQ